MQSAVVLGNAHATVRHPALEGWRLLCLQPLDIHGAADGCPILAIDDLGAGRGDTVFFTSDGSAVREQMGRPDSPVRYAVQGILDRSS